MNKTNDTINNARGLFAIFLSFCFLFLFATDSFASGSSYIICDCSSSHCSCFIQEGDEGNFVKEIVSRLIKKKYLPKNHSPKTRFSSGVTSAVKQFQIDNHLEPTGTMDDDTLTLLLWDMLPEELDKAMPLVPGSPDTYPDTVYIPTDGGEKRHASPDCCGMYDPRKVSIRNAAKAKFYACKIKGCERDEEKTMHLLH